MPANQMPHSKNYKSKAQRLNDFSDANLQVKQNSDP